MAMLAAPRRKQKVINLRAKNSEWSNDTNKFGQRMLEKMGWSSGKGLGAKENGMVEHVVARYKNDEKGLGFEDKNDQWTKHEDDFNSLLANISNGDNNEEKLHSGVSLEVKSKKSKARVHYHKFTRGKDLTRYSEKDLANIFGKKSLKSEVKAEEILKDDIVTTEQVFTEKGSMADYFKNKLATMKSNNNFSMNYSNGIEVCEADYSFKGFSGTANEDAGQESDKDVGFQGFSCNNTVSIENDQQINEIEMKEVDSKLKKKKKKSKKNYEEQTLANDHDENSQNHSVENTVEVLQPVKKKKSKKDKQEIELIPEVVNKSKMKKSKLETPSTNQLVEETIIEEDYHVPKKKKKRKNKNNEL